MADLINASGTPDTCYYCSKAGQTITIEALSEHVLRAINHHFVCTASEPEGYEYYVQRETGGWDRSGEPVVDVIRELLEADDAIAEDVRETLDETTSDRDGIAAGEEQPFSDDAHYADLVNIDHTSLSKEYRQFEEVLVNQARFFSPRTRAILATLFGQLDGLRTLDGRPVIVDAGPGMAMSGFVRARVFQDSDRLKQALIAPDLELGPPPPRLGRAGRLNAAGVSIFYGAESTQVAVSEVRPPVGSQVLVAGFELLRPVRLLDIDALQSLLVQGSLFDPEHVGRRQRAAFLNSFSQQFTRPVMPDHEAFEYIPTQAIADYLANEVEPALDGILYASAQAAGPERNVALFHRSSRVERLVTPKGMTSDVWFSHSTDDGYEIDYTVYESVDAQRDTAAEEDHDPNPFDFPVIGGRADPDTRTPTLRINVDSLQVLHINGVQVQCDAHPVHRSRHVRGDDPF